MSHASHEHTEIRRFTNSVGGVQHPSTTYGASTEFVGACTLGVHVLTTGLCGGDAGHGGRTSVEFKDEGSACIGARLDMGGDGGVTVPPDCCGYSVKIVVDGDAEALMLADAMEFAARELRDMLRGDR